MKYLLCPMLWSPLHLVRNRICNHHGIFHLFFAFKSIPTSLLCQLSQNHGMVRVGRDLRNLLVPSPQLNHPTWKPNAQSHYLLYLGHKKAMKSSVSLLCSELMPTEAELDVQLPSSIKMSRRKHYSGATRFVVMARVEKAGVTNGRKKQSRVLELRRISLGPD